MSDRPTGDYSPETPARHGRIRIVGGSGPVSVDDLYPLLLRRLRVLITIVLAYQLAIAAIILPQIVQDFRDGFASARAGGVDDVVARVSFHATIFVLIGLTALLWRKPPGSVRGLRLVELALVGLFMSQFLFETVRERRWHHLECLAEMPELQREAVTLYFRSIDSYVWFVVIMIYGTVIPNTPRRMTFVVVTIAAVPLALFAVIGFWVRPIDPETVREHLLFVGMSALLAVAVVVFAASRSEVLRRKVAEARRMGQYVLKEQLGAGGMGEVYRAEHVLLRRPCAIKLIRPERAGDPKNLRRFEREVQVTATLTHPNTVQIYDYGRADDGTFYYVMEYLPGSNLEHLVKHHGPLPPERVVHLLRQLCGALKEAHAAGLIHRDIKPNNVIVCERGGVHDVAKLLDFGIVDAPAAEPGESITAPNQLLGTPAYMSAEQAAGGSDLDARSDLASLGATAYFMLTGQPPFDRPTTNQIIAAQLRDPVTPPHIVRTGIPTDVSAVIAKCLEKDPARRFQDAAELERALASCKCAGGWTDERATEATQASPTSNTGQLSTRELERRWGI